MRGTERETGGRNLDNAQKPNAPAKTLNASVTQILRYFARPPSHVQLRDKKTRPANLHPPPPTITSRYTAQNMFLSPERTNVNSGPPLCSQDSRVARAAALTGALLACVV